MSSAIVWKSVKLPEAIIGQPYEAGLAMNGQVTAVTVTVKGGSTLPAGLVINADGVRITGTPTSIGLYTFILTATETAGAVDSSSFTLHVGTGREDDILSDSAAVQFAREWPAS